MKIAFISGSRDPSLPNIDSDGGGITVRNYALELGKMGYHIDIYTIRAIPSNDSNIYMAIKAEAQHDDIIVIGKNVKIIRQTIKETSKTNNKLLGFLPSEISKIKNSQNFANSFKKNLSNYEIICIFHPITAFGFFLENIIFPVTIKTILFPMLLSDEYKKFSNISSKYIKMEKEVLSKINYICSPSNEERAILIKKGINKNKIIVIPRGFDKRIFRYITRRIYSKNNKIKLICVGAIRPQKQQDKLIDIAELLIQRGYSPTITIVGETKNFYNKNYEDYYKKLRITINYRKLKNVFQFTGAISQKAVAKALLKSDFAVFPSIAESFGKAVLEAIVTGTPTIFCKSVSAYNNFAVSGENSLAVDDQPIDFVKAIESLLHNHILYFQISNKGINIRKDFSWQAVSKKLDLFLQEINKNHNFL